MAAGNRLHDNRDHAEISSGLAKFAAKNTSDVAWPGGIQEMFERHHLIKTEAFDL